jgi:hypothetical protein
MLRGMLGSKRKNVKEWRKFQNQELQIWDFSPDDIAVMNDDVVGGTLRIYYY